MTGLSRCANGPLEIALVNNMPDQALAATQAQFARLAHAGGREIRWRCYVLPGLERSETAHRYLERSYENIEALYRRGADGLIVTGCEPRAARLDQEPFWPQIQTLVDWARVHTLSTIWSCLAAHAATLHLCGVERRRAPRKVSGVYSFERCSEDWAGEAAQARSIAPHSRYNGLAGDELETHGFHVASWSPGVGVDLYWREEPSLFVFLQGHPEYDADTLLKEYRRDVLRYLSGARADYPEQPENYFSPEVARELEALRARMTTGAEADAEDALTRILSAEISETVWAEDAACLYRNWIDAISERAGMRRNSA